MKNKEYRRCYRLENYQNKKLTKILEQYSINHSMFMRIIINNMDTELLDNLFKNEDMRLMSDRSTNKDIEQYNLEGKCINEFKSLNEASIVTKISKNTIMANLYGRRAQAKGFVFKYKNNN